MVQAVVVGIRREIGSGRLIEAVELPPSIFQHGVDGYFY